MTGALYDRFGKPLGVDFGQFDIEFDGVGGLIHSRPVVRILYDMDAPDAHDRGGVDLIYVLPLGPGPHRIEPLDLVKMAACVNAGGLLTVRAAEGRAISEAFDLLSLVIAGEMTSRARL